MRQRMNGPFYHGRGWDPVVPAVFKTVGCDISQRQVRFLPLPHY